MRILHVSQAAITGGLNVVVRDYARDQVARGWDVIVACPKDGPLSEQVESVGASWEQWEAKRSPGTSIFRETRTLRQLVERVKPQIVHLHSAKAGLAGRLAIRGSIPTLFQPHAWSFEAVGGFIERAARRWERFAARWTNAVICVSEGEKSVGIKCGIRANYKVNRNGLDLTMWPAPQPDERVAARQRLAISDESSVAICVGRLCRQKGQDILVKAWPAVAARVENSELYVIGEGPDEDMLRKEATGSIVFTGVRTDVRDWYLAADVVVMPSRWEGLSIALLESMATGCPLVVTDVTGMRESLGDDCGIIVPAESPTAVSTALIEILRDPDHGSLLAARARARVESEFDVNVTCGNIADLYASLLDGGAQVADSSAAG